MTLPMIGQVGHDARQLLRTARCDAEAGDHLVEDEQRAALGRQRAQALEEAAGRAGRAPCWPGRARPGSRRAGRRRPRRGRRRGRSRARSWSPRRLAAGTPGEDGMPCVARPGAGLGEQAVDVAVVGAGELDQPLAAGGRAREPDRAHRRLGARRGHPQHLDRRHAVGDQLGQLDLGGGRGAERRPALGRGVHRREHRREGVAVDQRAPGADVVDVGVAVDVGELRAGGVVDEDRVAPDRAHRAHGRVHAAREDAERRGGRAPRSGCRSARRTRAGLSSSPAPSP